MICLQTFAGARGVEVTVGRRPPKTPEDPRRAMPDVKQRVSTAGGEADPKQRRDDAGSQDESQTPPGTRRTSRTAAEDPRRRKQAVVVTSCACARGLAVPQDQQEGVRRKSILRNGGAQPPPARTEENGNIINKDTAEHGKHCMVDIVGHKLEDLNINVNVDSRTERSWWQALCARCHQADDGVPSWEPPLWRCLCPPAFCPSYRQFAQVLALLLVGLLTWGVVFAVLGDTAAPGGCLFGLAALCIAAHFGGWVFSLLNLPALVGMLLVGALLQNLGLVHILDDYREFVSHLRHVALVIILTRAGLDLDPAALRSMWTTVLKLGLLPWVVECLAVLAMSHALLGLPWMWGLLLGSIIAAVSPAVVVPSLFRLRKKGYGVSKGIPTLVIAVSSIDDALSVAAFGIISSIMFSSGSLTFQIIQGPITLIGGIGCGILWGLLSKFVPEKNDPYVVPLRVLMLLGGGVLAMLGSEAMGLGGAGPLCCVTSAFVSIACWSRQGWEIDDNPVATAFEIFWMIFEPILFGITGTQLKISELNGDTVLMCFACLIVAIVTRIIATILLAWGSKLNLKEKIFVSLAWMSKAGVQAALGPVALATVADAGSADDRTSAQAVLTVSVLSILLTAPTGALLISLAGARLLQRTSAPQVLEGWRRSRKPSMRDFAVEEEAACSR
ncbi:sodium/hydrogen exchanger 9B2-like [Bacillus rossius redtenbacheri]|uniref:sodium/hydrogen exchanger 9B2-like n=1 Tax=Bacillus rossius redtenbacheri TaxID=93214 RepID=UPI002FDE129E